MEYLLFLEDVVDTTSSFIFIPQIRIYTELLSLQNQFI